MAPPRGATLDNWLAYLELIHPAEIDLGLDRVLLVLRRLMPRRPEARVITVGGTNGKGSTVAALETLLLAASETVGCYTSPHLLVYNERVRINGVDVDDAALIRAFERVEKARRGTTLTYFEFGTLAAFLVMEEAGVDNLVLEVGLGGRLDAVNVLDADLAIITSVDLDHTAWLGNDRNTIGFEKAGILRPGQLAIFADQDPPASILQQVAAQKVRLYRPGFGYFLDEDQKVVLEFAESSRRILLPGHGLPLTSLAAAAVAAVLLELKLDDAQISDLLREVRLVGRFEQILDAPATFVDVGHNPHAATWLARRLATMRDDGYGRVLAVYAGLEDKNSEGVASALEPVVDQWYIAGLDVPRGLTSEDLASRVERVIDPARIRISETVSEAIAEAQANAALVDLILIFGSFFTVGEAKAHLHQPFKH